MKNYLDILQAIFDHGYDLPPVERQDVGTKQIVATSFYHDLRTGFPLLTTKNVHFKSIAVELIWFLRGETNIKYLVDNGVNIWNEDAFNYAVRNGWVLGEYNEGQGPAKRIMPDVKNERHMELFKVFVHNGNFIPNTTFQMGDVGPGYGYQMRNFNGQGVDQILDTVEAIKKSIKTGANNRRIITNMWNPVQVSKVALPWCHTDFQPILEPGNFLNLAWSQRSVDTFLGLPFNIASYALLTHILGALTDTTPKVLVGQLKNVHLYDTHLDQAREQLTREPKQLPKLEFDEAFMWNVAGYKSGQYNLDQFIKNLHWTDFRLTDYDPHPKLKAAMVS